MTVSGDAAPFEPNREVDELRWCGPEEALELISYERDRGPLHDGLRRFASA